MESTKETGSILCINKCGFFGSVATMNMCSKCHKDMVLKQQQPKLAATSIENIVNNQKEVEAVFVELKPISTQPKAKTGPNRCAMCRKRVGLTGFNCKCGDLFCSVHRYSDKHECPFDYRTSGKDAIAKAIHLLKLTSLIRYECVYGYIYIYIRAS